MADVDDAASDTSSVAPAPLFTRGGGNGMTLLLSLIHISEPTRLGMISYAVFCLKKKEIYITQTPRRPGGYAA